MPKLKDFVCNDCIYVREDDCHVDNIVEVANGLGCSRGKLLIKMLRYKACKKEVPYFTVDFEWIVWAIVSGEKFQKVKVPE